MAATVDKIIFTNFDALRAKYGASGVTLVKRALGLLDKADKARGINDLLVDLGSATLSKYGATPIPAADVGDAKANKQAIDAVYAAHSPRPSYLMLLGAPDVIPHVPLGNPMQSDGDPDVPSDLPYACDQGYSQDPQHFLNPTRVVGRLPNVMGDRNPDYLVTLIVASAHGKAGKVEAYTPYFGLSAQVWQASTDQSLKAVFGNATDLRVSPTEGDRWTAPQLAKRLAHFINCHGAQATPDFYGQKGNAYPVAHSAAWMRSRVLPGTVVAAECCYGAELYDPAAVTAGGQMGLCNTYLGRGAFAWFGSSNIAYGPPSGNDQADLLCQYFLQGIRAGASAGRACLDARQRYVRNKAGLLPPVDLKTLAQFSVMADPSVTPVQIASPSTSLSKSTEGQLLLERHERQARRVALQAGADAIVGRRLEPLDGSEGPKGNQLSRLRKLAAEHGLGDPDVFISHTVAAPPSNAKSFAAHAMAAAPGPQAVHTVLQHIKPPAKVPQLRIVHGMQVIEYGDTADVRMFLSR